MALRDPLHPDPDTARDLLRRGAAASASTSRTSCERMQEWFQDLLDKVAGRHRQLRGAQRRGAARADGASRRCSLVFVLSRLRRNAGGRPHRPSRCSATSGARPPSTAGWRGRRTTTGVWDDAVVEGMRALAAGLVERQLVGRRARRDRPRGDHARRPALPVVHRPAGDGRPGLRRDAIRRPPRHPRARRRDARPRVARSRVPTRPTEAMPAVRWRRCPDERADHRGPPAQPDSAPPRPGAGRRGRGPGRGQPRQRPLRWRRSTPATPSSGGRPGGRQGARRPRGGRPRRARRAGVPSTHRSTRTRRWW